MGLRYCLLGVVLGSWRNYLLFKRQNRCPLTKNEVVVRATDHLPCLRVFKRCQVDRLNSVAFDWWFSKLVLLIRTPYIELVIFCQSNWMLHTASNSSDSFTQSVFAAGYSYRLNWIRSVSYGSQLTFVICPPTVHVASLTQSQTKVLSKVKVCYNWGESLGDVCRLGGWLTAVATRFSLE